MTDELTERARRILARCMRIVGLSSVFVPRRRREEWTREWLGELWHTASQLERSRDPGTEAMRLTLRSLGAFPHAMWTLTNEMRLDPMLQDLRYALRGMAKRPAFAALIIATLAVGIGANTAMFSIVNSVVLKPLPYEHPDELVYMYGAFKLSDQAMVSPPDYLDYRERNTVFSALGARTVFGTAVLSGGDEPENVRSSIASANFFSTLGLKPYKGRLFQPEEDYGVQNIALLSYGLWQRRYGADPQMVGQSIVIDGQAHTVVGILPPTLDVTTDVQIWRPVGFKTQETSVRRFHYLRLIGRLKPGVTIDQAQRHMDDIARQLASTYPENEGWHLKLASYRDVVVGNAGAMLFILLGAVGLVLLIACGNVASLLLARATARTGEMAIRTALGAERGRLIRQMLTESLVLGVTAGIVGIIVARYLLAGVKAVADGLVPRLAEVELDSRTLAFTVIISLLTSLIFGLAPALQTVRSDLAASMKSLGKGSVAKGGVRTRDMLVVGQVALSFVLLIGAGLLVRSLWQLQHVDTGFDPTRLLTAQVTLPEATYPTRADHRRFWARYLEAVRALPGVEAAAATTLLPLRGGGDTYFYIEGKPPASDAQKMNATVSVVTDDYFKTMRTPLVSGRAFGPSDDAEGAGVTVVSKALAERLFPGASAIGRRLVVDFGRPYVAEIVGVVADARVYGQGNDPPDLLYFSNRQPGGFGTGKMSLTARVKGEPATYTAQVRDALRAIEPDVPLTGTESMESILYDSASGPRFRTQLLAGFASVALLLAVIGLYGMLAYSVSRRSREMAIRIALGAHPKTVFGLVVRQGMMLVALGAVLGLAGALAATRLLRAQLFAVVPTDPLVFAVVSITLLSAGAAACILPARRATLVDPIGALRLE